MFFIRCKTVLEYIIGILMLAMFILISVQIVSRFFFNNPIIWSEELSRYIMIWMVFLGMPLGIIRNQHLRVELNIQNRFPELLKLFVNCFFDIFIIFIWILITKYGYLYAQNLKFIPALTFPLKKIWVVICIPISGILTMIFSIDKIMNQVKEYRYGIATRDSTNS